MLGKVSCPPLCLPLIIEMVVFPGAEQPHNTMATETIDSSAICPQTLSVI